MKVMLYAQGRMGEIARQTLLKLDLDVIEPDPTLEHAVHGDYDVLLSASWPARIPQFLCDRAKIAVNIHTSLLPEGRGSHPLNWALIWGKKRTGITIHKIVDTYDAGDILLQRIVPIDYHDNIISLRERVEEVFPLVLEEFFQDPESFPPIQQNQAHASYAQKRRPEDGLVNLNAEPDEVYNFVRAHHPTDYPAFFYVKGQRRRITGATIHNGLLELNHEPWE
jgi:methionyl-tRNA formyltransferase